MSRFFFVVYSGVLVIIQWYSTNQGQEKRVWSSITEIGTCSSRSVIVRAREEMTQ